MLSQLRPRRTIRCRRPEPIHARVSDDLDALEQAWPITDCCPSAGFAWLRAARTAFAESEEAQVFTAAARARVQAGTAMVRVRHHGIWHLAPPGHELKLPTELAATDSRSLQCLATALARCGQPIALDRVVASSPSVRALGRACRGHAISVVRPAAPYLFVPLDESWAEPERHLLAVERRRLALKRRRAERLGPVHAEIHAPDLDELPHLLDLVFDLATTGGRPVTNSKSALPLSEAIFFRQYAEAACIDGTLRVCVLRIGDRPAAVQMGVETGTALWLLRRRGSAFYPLPIVAVINLRNVALRGASQSSIVRILGRATTLDANLDRPPAALRFAADLSIGSAGSGCWYRGRRCCRFSTIATIGSATPGVRDVPAPRRAMPHARRLVVSNTVRIAVSAIACRDHGTSQASRRAVILPTTPAARRPRAA